MGLNELEQRILPFSRFHYGDQNVQVTDIFKMPGHAGFSYGFTVNTGSRVDSWYLRLPPPNVKLQGTADVLRQVTVLNLLSDRIPHCKVKWSGEDPRWFGRPYFIVPQLEGDVVRMTDEWIKSFDAETRKGMARQAVQAMSDIHNLDWSGANYLGQPIKLHSDVGRWDKFAGKGADSKRLKLATEVKRLLLSRIPESSKVGIFHGDFQWSNLFYSKKAKLLAVIDWELVGIGSVLNDLGWFATFNDPLAWDDDNHSEYLMPEAEELVGLYADVSDTNLQDISWFRALAAYKFAIITSFNLMLHRRKKRPDPSWEITKNSIEPLLARARTLLLV